ncbi:MAG: NfeD family protein [Syntrophales bacterium]|nr:NfeD family protein [Syntrophales bacterium]
MTIELWQVWIIAGIVLWILELFTPGFVMGIFGTSCFLVALLAYLNLSFSLQLFFFAIATLFLFVLIRPLLLKYFYRKDEGAKTNVEAMIGKEGIVTAIVDPIAGVGEVKIRGEIWRALPVSGESLEIGNKVIVRAIEGITLIVEKMNK